MSTDLRDVLTDLEQEGWVFTRTSKGHWRGKHRAAPGKVLIVSSKSSTDWRAGRNVRATARRLVS